jgi:hypothetical protein
MDDGDAGAATHNNGQPDAAHQLAVDESEPKSVALRGVSQIRTPSSLEVL